MDCRVKPGNCSGEAVPLRKLQRHARACPGHPRLSDLADQKTWMAGTSPAMTMRGCALREKISTAVFDFNPITEYSPSVRSARGRSHEASCGRDRMRRLRACLASTHSGGAGAPPGGHYGLPARSWLTAVVHKSDDPRKACPAAGRKNAAMARREAPAFSRGNAARQNNGCATWRAIPLYFQRGPEEGRRRTRRRKETGR